MHVLHELVPRGPLLLQAKCMLDFNKLKRGRTNNIVFYTFTGMLLSALQLHRHSVRRPAAASMGVRFSSESWRTLGASFFLSHTLTSTLTPSFGAPLPVDPYSRLLRVISTVAAVPTFSFRLVQFC